MQNIMKATLEEVVEANERIRAGKAWELYDLKADPTETNNLAKERPEKTAELATMWEAWREDYKNKPK